MVKYENLNITDLLLNPTNPRHNAVEHQSESITAMVEDQKEKLIFLARHIVDNGLNPTEFILAKLENGKWVVREGNRRITVLKLLNEPLLIPTEYPKIRKEFQKLGKSINRAIFQAIPCVILDNESEINEWVRLKHTGQNEGAGAVGWDGQQTSRFKANVDGKSDMKTLFLDFLLNFLGLPENIRSKLYNIKKTNFDRLMSDPDVRRLVGLKVEDNTLLLVDGLNRFLLMVLDDLVENKITVGGIYHKPDRELYIQKLKKRALEEDKSQSESSHNDNFEANSENAETEDTSEANPENAETDDDFDSNSGNVETGNTSEADSGNAETEDASEANSGNAETEASEANSENTETNDESEDDSGDANTNDNPDDQSSQQNSTSQKSTKGRSYPINRNTVAASIHKLVIGQPRILKIFNELKTLSLQDYANASAVLFRTFIELSADHYLEQKRLIQGRITVDSNLGVKIDAVSKHIQDSGRMTENQLRVIRQMTSSPTQNQSVKTFHAYVHNKNLTPSTIDLKSAWDDLWPFIEKMWS